MLAGGDTFLLRTEGIVGCYQVHAVWLRLGHISATSRPPLGHLSATSRPPLGHLSATSKSSDGRVRLSSQGPRTWWRHGLSKVQPVAKMRFVTTGRERCTVFIYVNAQFVPGV